MHRRAILWLRCILWPPFFVLEENEMLDLLYVLLTMGFFALCAAYVRGCERLCGKG